MPYGTIKVDNITFDNGGTDKLITVSGLFFSTSGALTVTGTISGGNVTAPTATFTTLTGTTTAGTTATFTSGSFTSLTGVTTTGTTATFTSGSFTSLTGVTTTVTSGVFSSGIVTAPSVAIGSGTTYKPGIYSPGTDQVAISTNGTGRLFIDSSGRLLVGTSTARSNLTFGGVGISPLYQVESTGAESSISITRNATNNLSNARLVFAKNNSATLGTNVLVDSGEVLGEIAFNGNDGTNFIVGANITGEVDGTPGANDMPGRLVFSTTADGAASPTERMRVDANGCVGVGMTPDNQAYRLQIYNSSQDVAAISLGNNVSGSGSSNGLVIVQNQTDTQILNRENGYLSIATNNTERARIDSSGRLLVGTSTARANFYNSSNTSRLQVEGTASDTGFSRISAVFNDNSANGDSIIIGKTRGSTAGSATAVISQDNIGYLSFQAADGTELVEAASISAAVDGTPGANDMPGRLVFSTTADGAASPTERMTLFSNGFVKIGNTSSAYVYPGIDNSLYLGSPSFRWNLVYSVNGTASSSDEREKTEISDASLGIDFVKSLRPVSYKWKIGHNDVETNDEGDVTVPRPGLRTHWGFLAQEVKQSADDAGVDFGGWILTDTDDPESSQGLRYQQFIAPLTKALQEAIAKIEALEADVAALKGA